MICNPKFSNPELRAGLRFTVGLKIRVSFMARVTFRVRIIFKAGVGVGVWLGVKKFGFYRI